jgi:mono/diheme cytochrome c family protein
MPRVRFVAVVGLAGVVAASVHHTGLAAEAQSPARQTTTNAAPKGSATDGQKLFVSYGCYQCHGYEAQGSSATGPRLGPRPLPFASFARYVRQPSGQMPPYTSKVVSDKAMADLYAFVESRPAPPVAIPLLK